MTASLRDIISNDFFFFRQIIDMLNWAWNYNSTLKKADRKRMLYEQRKANHPKIKLKMLNVGHEPTTQPEHHIFSWMQNLWSRMVIYMQQYYLLSISHEICGLALISKLEASRIFSFSVQHLWVIIHMLLFDRISYSFISVFELPKLHFF